MATVVSTDILNSVVDYFFRGQSAPAALENAYIGLLLDASGTEVKGGNYSRVLLSGKLDPPVDGLCRNGTALIFPVPTATWGRVVGIGIYDAETEGNLLAGGAVKVPKDIATGYQLTMGTGELKLSLSVNITPYFRDAVLRWMLYGEAMPTAPTSPYIGLLRSQDPAEELSGGGYCRMSVAGNFDPATGGATTYALPIAFPTPTAAWGTATHVGYFGSASGGQAYFVTVLDAPFTAGIGDTVRFNVASLVCRVGAV